MGNLLANVITWSLASFTSRFFTAIGISLTTYKGLSTLVDNLLKIIEPHLSKLPIDVVIILELMGLSEALTIIASALATRAVFIAARVFITTVDK